MKFGNDRKKLTEFLTELKINKKTITAVIVYLKDHKISYQQDI